MEYELADSFLLEGGSMSSLSHSSDHLSSAVREGKRTINGIFPTNHQFAYILPGSIIVYQYISVSTELEFCCASCNKCTALL